MIRIPGSVETIANEAVIHRGALQKPEELAALLRVVDKLEPEIIVEIGSDCGGTTWALHETSGAAVCSVTLPDGPYSTGRPMKVPDGVHVIQGNSHAPATKASLLGWLEGRSVDLLMIDGDHSTRGVADDFSDYAPLVRAGGMIVFHDIVEHLPHLEVGVRRIWMKLRGRYPDRCHEFIFAPFDWGGIGVYIA